MGEVVPRLLILLGKVERVVLLVEGDALEVVVVVEELVEELLILVQILHLLRHSLNHLVLAILNLDAVELGRRLMHQIISLVLLVLL